jgi:hypothetical protein
MFADTSAKCLYYSTFILAPSVQRLKLHSNFTRTFLMRVAGFISGMDFTQCLELSLRGWSDTFLLSSRLDLLGHIKPSKTASPITASWSKSLRERLKPPGDCPASEARYQLLRSTGTVCKSI